MRMVYSNTYIKEIKIVQRTSRNENEMVRSCRVKVQFTIETIRQWGNIMIVEQQI